MKVKAPTCAPDGRWRWWKQSPGQSASGAELPPDWFARLTGQEERGGWIKSYATQKEAMDDYARVFREMRT